MIETSTICGEVSAALAIAQSQIRAASKSGHNTFDRYEYAKLEDYLQAAREPLAANGLAIVFSNAEVETMPDRPTQKGGTDHAVRAKVCARIVHKSGEWIQAYCFGEGQDRADKSIYKALTGAKKYLVAGLLAIPTTDDPESDERSDVAAGRPPGPPARSAPAKPAPAQPAPVAAAPAAVPADAPAPNADRDKALALYQRLRLLDQQLADKVRSDNKRNYVAMAAELDRVLVDRGELPPA